MPPAARVGDTSVHGGTIAGPGVATVLIGGMPASILGDTHVCPIVPPHPPASPFVVGSGTVLIGGMPAVRVGDTCACGATAAVGEPTVIIG